MSQKSIILIIVVFILLVIGMFIFASLKKTELTDLTPPTEVPVGESEDVPYAYIDRIDAKHFYLDGKHSIVGEIEMPTPCDLVDTSVSVAESMPEQVTIDFTVVNTAETCIQVITPYRFRVDFDASAEAVIKARFMGREVILNLLPAGEDETPEDFELFIKG